MAAGEGCGVGPETMTTPPRKTDDADAEDVWVLQRDPGETDDEYAFRCIALGCAPNGTIKLKRWRLAGDRA